MAVTSAQIVDFLLANPSLTDAEIVASMETYGVSPAQMAAAVGIPEGEVVSRVGATVPEGQAKLLGDTWVQPVYQVIGSGEDRQVGGIENVLTYKTTGGINDAVATGTDVQYYSPTGEFQQTTQTQAVDNSLLPFVLGSAALFGGIGGGFEGLLGGGGAATLGSTGLTATELAALDLATGGAGGTAGATSLAGALTTGADVATLSNLTGGSGLLTGEAGGITAQSVADKLAADAAAQAAADAAAKAAADATAKAAADAAAAKAASDAAAAKAAADAAIGADAATKAAADAAAAKAAADAAAAKAAADAAAATAATSAATATSTAATATAATAAASTAATTAATTAAAAAATGLTTAQIAAAGLTTAQIASLISGATTTASGLLQQQTSKEAALAAQKIIDAETAAAKQAAQFRPIGMTTRFGTSQFGFDPKTGQLTSAGYTLDPQAKNAQDRLVKLAEQGLQQAEVAQTKFAPLQTGAQSLFGLGQGFLDAKNDPALDAIAKQYLSLSQESKDLTKLGGGYLTLSPESKLLTSLGSKYLAQSPEDVAKNYLTQQMALLQPGRELELANLQNKLQQQGRGGLAVAQGGTLGATTPELQALFNARVMQEAQLAANAQQAGQRDVLFGAGLVGTGQQLGIQGQQFGANLIGSGQQLGIQGQQFGMDTLARQQALEQQRIGFGSGLLTQGAGLQGQYYAGQQAAYAPYTTAMGQVQNLETLAQQPYTMGIDLGKIGASTGFDVGRLGLQGAGQSVALATGPAATNNPYASLLAGAASSPVLTEALAKAIFG